MPHITVSVQAAPTELTSWLALARRLEATGCTPFLLIGSHEEMAAQMIRQAEELGITGYVVREPAVPDLERVLALMKSTSRQH
jgi:alkanesulfonate monooxygenase SsuD/methylene tetrahydromethanopterin reductase-like flavin-dependent oxidoreductase (luciferase family)